MSDEYNVAVDIGSTKVCTIITRKCADHRVEVRGLGLVPCTGMDKGMIVDSVAVTESVQNSIKMAASRAEISVSNVHIGLTGSHIESINRWSKVPRWNAFGYRFRPLSGEKNRRRNRPRR